MTKQDPPVVVYVRKDDSAAKFMGMDVPHGCGCSPWLFLAFVIVIILASVIEDLTK